MMCAFMTPVLKNDWEVYKTQRTRNPSEDSGSVGVGSAGAGGARASRHASRRRIGEAGRSFSYAAPPGHYPRLQHPDLQRHCHTARNSRYASRASMEPMGGGAPGGTSPPLNGHDAGRDAGIPKTSSASSMTKFHNKVMDKLKSVLHLKESPSKSTDDEETTSQS